MADGRPRVLGADAFDNFLEPLPILAGLDRVDVSTDEFDAVLLQHSGLMQRDRGIERGLAAQSCEQRVRPLFGDDFLDVLGVMGST